MTRSEGELGVPDGDFQIRNGKTWGIYLKTMCFYCDSKHTTYLIFWNFPCLFLVIRVYFFLYHPQITHLSNLLWYLIIILLSSWHFSSSACMPPSAPPPTSMVYNTYHLHCSFLLLFFCWLYLILHSFSNWSCVIYWSLSYYTQRVLWNTLVSLWFRDTQHSINQ